MIRRLSVALAALAFLTTGQSASGQSPISGVVLGWNANGNTADFIAQASAAPGLNTVSPAWWYLDSGGNVTSGADRAYADWAHAHGMKVWPLFGNSNDQPRTHLVLSDPARRAAVIARIGELAKASGADGVNLDWENMSDDDREGFSVFVREASDAWHKIGLVVSVDLTVLTPNWSLGNWSTSFDRAAVGQAADVVMLMAYDQHNRLRRNGPVASLPWVKEALDALLVDVPASKIILGLPFYTYEFPADQNAPIKTLTLASTPARLKTVGAKTRWDAELGLMVATYSDSKGDHTIWVEDERSLALKVAVAAEHKLAGVAVWRMGFGTSSAWRAASGQAPLHVAPAPVAAPVVRPVATAAPTPAPTAVPETPTPIPTATATPVVVKVAASKQIPHKRGPGTTAVAAVLCAMAAIVTARKRFV